MLQKSIYFTYIVYTGLFSQIKFLGCEKKLKE